MGFRKRLLADMTAQGTVSTDAAQDAVVEVVVNNKMRAVRYCKDKMGTMSAAHLVTSPGNVAEDRDCGAQYRGNGHGCEGQSD